MDCPRYIQDPPSDPFANYAFMDSGLSFDTKSFALHPSHRQTSTSLGYCRPPYDLLTTNPTLEPISISVLKFEELAWGVGMRTKRRVLVLRQRLVEDGADNKE